MTETHRKTSTTDTGNNRVTLAVLATKLDYVLADLHEIKTCIKSQDTRIEQLERVVGVLKWIGAGITTILIAIVIASIKSWLGL